MSKLCYVVWLSILLQAIDAATVPSVDSYLSALTDSRNDVEIRNETSRREDPSTFSEFSPMDGSSVNSYIPPSTNYGTPVYAPPDNYSPPSTNYGGPYHKPDNQYLPSKPVYGAPSYLPPPMMKPYQPMAPMEMSKGSAIHKWLWDNLKFKIDLYTIGKLLLKLIIFKKIVKFFAIICMLLVLPILKSKVAMTLNEGDDMDEMDMLRSYGTIRQQEQLNEITMMVTRAIETFAVQTMACDEEVSSPQCKLLKFFIQLARQPSDHEDEPEANDEDEEESSSHWNSSEKGDYNDLK